MTVSTSDQSKAGHYYLRLYAKFITVNGNNGFLDFDIVVCGTCCYTSLTIQGSIVSSSIINYNVNDPLHTETIDASLVDSTVAGCTVSFMEITNGGLALAAPPFVWVPTSNDLVIQTTNSADPGTYTLTLEVSIDPNMPASHNPSATLDFTVIISPSCETSPITIGTAIIAQPIVQSVYHPTHQELVISSHATSTQASCDSRIVIKMGDSSLNDLSVSGNDPIFLYDSANYKLNI